MVRTRRLGLEAGRRALPPLTRGRCRRPPRRRLPSGRRHSKLGPAISVARAVTVSVARAVTASVARAVTVSVARAVTVTARPALWVMARPGGPGAPGSTGKVPAAAGSFVAWEAIRIRPPAWAGNCSERARATFPQSCLHPRAMWKRLELSESVRAAPWRARAGWGPDDGQGPR